MKSAPIIELLSELTRKSIQEQVSWLEKLSNEDEDKLRFKNMVKGAETIINIIENDPIGERGTTNFLNNLDREQLKYAISSAQEILQKKSSLGMVLLFGVFGGANGAKWFTEAEDAKSDYLEAAKESLKDRRPEISLEERKVPLEEVEGYLGSQKANELIESL